MRAPTKRCGLQREQQERKEREECFYYWVCVCVKEEDRCVVVLKLHIMHVVEYGSRIAFVYSPLETTVPAFSLVEPEDENRLAMIG